MSRLDYCPLFLRLHDIVGFRVFTSQICYLLLQRLELLGMLLSDLVALIRIGIRPTTSLFTDRGSLVVVLLRTDLLQLFSETASRHVTLLVAGSPGASQ